MLILKERNIFVDRKKIFFVLGVVKDNGGKNFRKIEIEFCCIGGILFDEFFIDLVGDKFFNLSKKWNIG